MKKKTAAIAGAILTAITLACSSGQMTAANINAALTERAEKINKNRNEILKLDKMGYPGYYYILNEKGKILYHPKKSLINLDFSRYDFVKVILQEKNGAFTMTINNTETSVFYRELSDGSILCYSIESSKYTDSSGN
jgi:methyl-accepting chemotaxis protein